MDPTAGQPPPGLLPTDAAAAGLPPGFVMPGVMPHGLQMPPGATMPLGHPPGVMPLPAAAAIPGMNDPTVLSQLAGIPAGLIRDMPTMAAAAQNLSMQHLIQQQHQQMAALAGMPFPMMQAPAAPLASPQAPQSGAKGGRGGGRGRPKGGRSSGGRGGAAAAAAVTVVEAPLVKDDPGGKVIWAKSGHLPWWPAKTLDPSRDRSFPPDADPPRPTAIPIRFFGTHEFAWLGSKRAMAEWDDGLAQHGGGADTDNALAAAVAEANTYLTGRTLPDAFYIQPEPENVKRPAKGGRKRGAPYRNTAAREEGGVAAGGMTLGITPTGQLVQMVAPPSAAPAANVQLGRPRQRGPAEPSPAERAALVHERKKARLREMGLMPPENSPFVCGAVAPNPALLERAAAWEAEAPAVMAAAREEASAPEVTAPPRATIAPPPPPEAKAASAAQAAAAAAQAQQAAAVAAAMGMGVGVGGIPVMGSFGGVMPVITPEQMQAMQGAMMGMPGAPFG